MNDKEKKYIFASLFVIANRLQVLGDKLDPNLTVKQWLLIACISKCGTAPTISEVANTIGNSRQNVKKMAVILKREGFLDLKKDSKDARILRICLTDKCQKYFKKREGTDAEFIEQLFEGFDTNLIIEVYKGIAKLDKNIEEMEKKYGEEQRS
ncbi:MarR family winged helix-turn-helix transcriptional regulator [Sedimentibacter sp. MB31-C6]|uniref:MarR family winged helix-turn-helix transcriptional regulator n=1 Tax=Sedimentibacter sp. MB31-C6 TaxID=3109366 RepID=UPI002DDD67F1|nr:MarR family transcriptional regulator [Sedimentibacter sp. MB36-C1]WSI03708.1 MarR family transcriptional regulator [Sedimentibacter sp. MB36-C1]